MQTTNHPQIKAVAEIIQRVRPDVLLLNEFDYDKQAAKLFQKNYLAIGQNGAKPVTYPYVYSNSVNTGKLSGHDLNNNGKIDDPNDCFGFGRFEGQYGMLILSKFPIKKVRTFQKFLWKDMPDSLLPKDWYSTEAQKILRLSSKSHWDVSINIGDKTIHVLASHPVPPIFDGPENRNGKRNHDELRFWLDYITPGNSSYIYDDQKVQGGLASKSFVIMGDLNADSNDGESIPAASSQLLKSPLINATVTPSSKGALEAKTLQGGVNLTHQGNPAYDTGDWWDSKNGSGNLRVDYVLPSKDLKIVDAEVFWPIVKDPLHHLIKGSDHRMVWVDVSLD